MTTKILKSAPRTPESSSNAKTIEQTNIFHQHLFNEIRRTVHKGIDSKGLFHTLQDLSNVFLQVSKKDSDFSNSDRNNFKRIVKQYKGNSTLFYIDNDLKHLLSLSNTLRPSANEEHGMWIAKVGYKYSISNLKDVLVDNPRKLSLSDIYNNVSLNLTVLSNFIRLSSLVFEGKNRSVIKQLRVFSPEEVQQIPEKTQQYILKTFTTSSKIVGNNNETIIQFGTEYKQAA